MTYKGDKKGLFFRTDEKTRELILESAKSQGMKLGDFLELAAVMAVERQKKGELAGIR